MELRLTDNEQEFLLELLEEQYKHLLHQINKAHYHEFKDTLRERCSMLENIVTQLKTTVSPRA